MRLNVGQELREGVSWARVSDRKRNASGNIQGDADVEEEVSVRRGRTAECLLFTRLVTLIVMNRVGWFMLGRLKP